MDGVINVLKEMRTLSGSRDMSKKRCEKIMEICKETDGHVFAHYWTCKTCEDGWDMVIDFVIKEIEERIT